MAIGIENESGKIIWTVFRMEPEASVIASAVFKRRSIERGHGLVRRRAKGNMKAISWHDDSFATNPDGKFNIIIGAG